MRVSIEEPGIYSISWAANQQVSNLLVNDQVVYTYNYTTTPRIEQRVHHRMHLSIGNTVEAYGLNLRLDTPEIIIQIREALNV